MEENNNPLQRIKLLMEKTPKEKKSSKEEKLSKGKVIAIDFDNTMVLDDYPKIGQDNPMAVDTMKLMLERGHKIILYTIRQGEELDAAVKWCEDRDIELYGINKNKAQSSWNKSPKIYAHYYIDDKNIGIPLKNGAVDWDKLQNDLKNLGLI